MGEIEARIHYMNACSRGDGIMCDKCRAAKIKND